MSVAVAPLTVDVVDSSGMKDCIHPHTPTQPTPIDTDPIQSSTFDLQPHSFLPNLLRLWLWSRPPQQRHRRRAGTIAATAAERKNRRLLTSTATDDTDAERATGSKQLSRKPSNDRKAYSSQYGSTLLPPSLHPITTTTALASPVPIVTLLPTPPPHIASASPRPLISPAFSSAAVTESACASAAAVVCAPHRPPPPVRLGRSFRQAQMSGCVSRPSSFLLTGAILFLDIGGYTALSERLGKEGMMGVESLNRTLNLYFAPIVEMIEQFGGDVVKFAGDALMVLFCYDPFTDDNNDSNNSSSNTAARAYLSPDFIPCAREPFQPHMQPTSAADRSVSCSVDPSTATAASLPAQQQQHDLSSLVYRACECAAAVHETFGSFSPVEGIVLQLHSAVSAGAIYPCVVGGAFDRYEFLLQSNAIAELAAALQQAKVGDIVITDSAYVHVKERMKAEEVCVIDTAHMPTAAASAAQADIAARSISAPAAASTASTAPTAAVAAAIDGKRASVSVWRLTRLLNAEEPAASADSAAAFDSRALSLSVTAVGLVRAPSTSNSCASASVRADRSRSVSSLAPPTAGRTGTGASGGDGVSAAPSCDVSASPSPRTRAQPLSRQQSVSAATGTNASANANAAAYFLIPSVFARVAEGQGQFLAEFRRITTLFISLPPLQTSSLDPSVHTQALAELSRIFCLCLQIILPARGEIRQLITDDKGTCLIAVFGMHAHTLNPLKGLKAAAEIHMLMRRRGHAVSIGVTTGQVFCGCVGTQRRCESVHSERE